VEGNVGLEEPMHDKDDTQEPSKTRYQKIKDIITTIIAILILAILGGYLIVYLTAPLI
jgi:hypothetical protein